MAMDPSRTAASEQEPTGDASPGLARFLRSGYTLWVFAAVAVGGAIAAGAIGDQRAHFDPDEVIYERVIHLFADNLSLDLLRDYGGQPASPAPVFFLLYAAVGKLFGMEASVFRALSVILTLLAVACVWLHLRREPGREHRDHFPLLLLAFPYIFSMAFSVMAEPVTLLLTAVALCCYLNGLERNRDGWLLAGSVAVVFALHVRVHAVFVPAALCAVLLLRRDRSVYRWCLALAPIAARVPLILLQGGLTVSREAFQGTKPELGICLSNVNFFFVWFGYVFFPLLWWRHGRLWINLVAAIALIPFYALATPDFLGTEHYGALRTFFVRFDIGSTSAQWLMLPVWFAGCYMSVDLVQRAVAGASVRERFLSACVILAMASLVFSTVVFERYYQLVVPVIVLLGVRRTRRMSGYVAWLACHILFVVLAAARLASDMP